MVKRTRKRFSAEFKREAVRLLAQGDKESSQLARELGIRRNQLYKWKAEVDSHGRSREIKEIKGGDQGVRTLEVIKQCTDNHQTLFVPFQIGAMDDGKDAKNHCAGAGAACYSAGKQSAGRIFCGRRLSEVP